jgi:hypothetical protein
MAFVEKIAFLIVIVLKPSVSIYCCYSEQGRGIESIRFVNSSEPVYI